MNRARLEEGRCRIVNREGLLVLQGGRRLGALCVVRGRQGVAPARSCILLPTAQAGDVGVDPVATHKPRLGVG